MRLKSTSYFSLANNESINTALPVESLNAAPGIDCSKIYMYPIARNCWYAIARGARTFFEWSRVAAVLVTAANRRFSRRSKRCGSDIHRAAAVSLQAHEGERNCWFLTARGARAF